MYTAIILLERSHYWGSVVHKSSGLEPGSGLDSSRLESLGIQFLAARPGVDELTRASWRLKPAQTWLHEPIQTLASSLLAGLGVSWWLELTRVGSPLGLGSAWVSNPGYHELSWLVNNTILGGCTRWKSLGSGYYRMFLFLSWMNLPYNHPRSEITLKDSNCPIFTNV